MENPDFESTVAESVADDGAPSHHLVRDFSIFYLDVMPELTRHAARRGVVADAEDAAHEAMAVLWHVWDSVPAFDRDRRRFVFGVLRNVVSRYHRSARRTHVALDRLATLPSDPCASETAGQVAGEAWVSDLVHGLSRPLGQIVELVVLQGHTARQAAHKLRITEEAARARLLRARRRLAELIEGGEVDV